jgi:RNA polymerase sigma factor for flagellar operon FliA
MPSRVSKPYAAENFDEALRQYSPLVRRIALQIAPRLPASVDLDDMIQEGMTGLLDALKRYEPQPGLSFETYARMRIKGAIYDSFRRDDILPRHQRQKLKEIEEATRQLGQRLGRAPEETEIAEASGLSIGEYFEILDSAVSICVMDELPEGVEPTDDQADPMQSVSLKEHTTRIEALLQRLPERERQVVALHYQEQLSYREIAYVMRLTPGRICQLHTQAMLRLRSGLGLTIEA